MGLLLQKDKNETRLSLVAKDILQILLYFNIFKYPLKAQEILINSSIEKITLTEINESLDILIQKQLVRKFDDFYKPGLSEAKISERIKGNIKAATQLNIGKRMGRFISYFPFVRGVFISGSLSKGYMDKNSDIDFFVVTSPNRLWLARTLLILFKKMFLFNSRRYFCPNYFIDNEHLEIPDRNFFTAKELSYLFPVFNAELYSQLLESNKWRLDYMPNFPSYKNKIFSGDFLPKKILEKILNGRIGEFLDNFCMKITESFWRRKYRNVIKGDLNIRCRKHVSKFHPKGFQDKVLQKYANEIKAFENQFKVSLADD
jgi:predicted nucleotidyltransferase